MSSYNMGTGVLDTIIIHPHDYQAALDHLDGRLSKDPMIVFIAEKIRLRRLTMPPKPKQQVSGQSFKVGRDPHELRFSLLKCFRARWGEGR